MADLRIKDLPESVNLEAGDYVAVDSTSSGTRRFLLRDLVNNFGAPEYVVNVNASGEADKTLSEILSAISDGYVPAVNRVGTYFRLSNVTETGVTFTNNDDPTNVASIRIISGGTVINEGSVTSTQVTNASDVTGAKITDALNDLASNITYVVNDIGTIQDNIDGLDDRVTTLENEGGSSGSGLTQTEKNLILSLFSKAAYLESDSDIAYGQLEALWATSEKTITYNLTNVESSNNATTIESGSGYATALSTRQGYSLNNVTVTMGGVDVTSNYYTSGSITIPRVTGDIIITATAVIAAQSITATYTQSGTVYDTASLDDLKSDLVVTASYADGTSATVTDYTLSGTLTEGTSVVTVSYGGKTDTFNVTVSHLTINAINLPYGAYVDTEYVPASVSLKYLVGVQFLSSSTVQNLPFAGMNRLPASTISVEEYWHVYLRTGSQNSENNNQRIGAEIGAYKNGMTDLEKRTANGTQYNADLITNVPFYFFFADGEQKIRADEEMTTNLVTGSFSETDSTYAYNAVTAEAPIDSFWLGKVNQCGSRTIAEFEGGVKIFCFKVWDENDNLLINMHPAMSGSAIGMYDSVRNKFCEAQGTGAYLS